MWEKSKNDHHNLSLVEWKSLFCLATTSNPKQDVWKFTFEQLQQEHLEHFYVLFSFASSLGMSQTMLSRCTVINSLLMNHSQTDLSFSKWTRFGTSVQITIFLGERLLCSSFRHFFVKPPLLLSSCFLHHHSVMSVFIPADMLPEAGGCVPVYQSLVAFVVIAVR